jgi:Beta-carotene isomerase D27-like, C-terminal
MLHQHLLLLLLGISAVLQLQYSFCQGLVTSSPQQQHQRLVAGPDPATKPDYDAIHGPLGAAVDQVFLRIFHASLHEQVRGRPYQAKGSSAATFDDIAQLAREMSQTEPPAVVQAKSLAVLRSLFPPWLPRQYKIWFSGPFPAFSCRMNAWATYVAGTWLMGECNVNDLPQRGTSQGLHVQRCRFLESSGCASICVNACKIPTQTFFRTEMGIDLLMEPNYETYECQFSFGTSPTAETELAALQTPCLAACPTVNRQRHPTTTTITIPTAATTAVVAAATAEITTTKCPPLSLLCALSDTEQRRL